MAFEMTACTPVNVVSIDYKKYLHKLRNAGDGGCSLWRVVAPLSLLGGGSIQLGCHNSEAEAERQLRDYFRMLMDEKAVEAKKKEASGEQPDVTLRLHGISMPPPPPDMNKPAFIISTRQKQLVLEKRCPTCKNPVIMADLSTELTRREYSISGMCAVCQTSVFGPPKTESEPRALTAAEVDQFKTLLSQLGIFQPATTTVLQQELFVGEQTLQETAAGEAFFDNDLDVEDAILAMAACDAMNPVPGNPPPITNPRSLHTIRRFAY